MTGFNDTQTIYLDVLVILNIYVSYFLFIGSGKLMSLKLSKLRLFLGSIAGGMFSLIILFEVGDIELLLIKLLMGIALVLIVFADKNIMRTLKCGLYFFLVNFIYGGFMLALWTFFAPQNMAYRNGVAYFNISALTLVISTIAAYLAISLFCNILNRRAKPQELIAVTLSLNGREAIINSFVDTGNKLCDIYTGLPVIVVEYSAVADILPEKISGYFKNPIDFSFDEIKNSDYSLKLKLIPVSVVGHDFALPAFKPDNVIINDVNRAAIVAVTTKVLSEGSFNGIIGEVLL